MSWHVHPQNVAEPTSAVVTGSIIAGGAQVHVDVSFRVIEWPWGERGPVSLVPQPAEITARTANGELKLGYATPSPGTVLIPTSHSSTATLRFTLSLSTAALSTLEVLRSGGSLEFITTLTAHPFLIFRQSDYAPGINLQPTTTNYPFTVPKEQWLNLLRAVGFCDTLIVELRLPTSGPDSTTGGRRRLVEAVRARDDGSYAEALRRCRIALDELKNAGFGGKAPGDVAKFLQDRAGALSQSERFSALQLALQLFLSPAHHANAPEEHYSRADAELAIAATATLLRLAPQHLPTEAEPATGGTST